MRSNREGSEAHVNALIAHPDFRLADKKPRPFFWQANRYGGICAGRA
jgi:hypothetical protein